MMGSSTAASTAAILGGRTQFGMEIVIVMADVARTAHPAARARSAASGSALRRARMSFMAHRSRASPSAKKTPPLHTPKALAPPGTASSTSG